MDKYKVNAGSKVSLTTAFDTVQSYISGNIVKRFFKLFKTKGVFDTQSASTGLKATALSTTSLSIAAGSVLLESGDMIVLDSAVTVAPLSLLTCSAATSYKLVIKYSSLGSEPIIASNGFYYDKTGDDPYTTKFAKYTDSYSFVLKLTSASLETDEHAICSFTTDTPATTFDTASLADLRTIAKLESDLIDPADVVMTLGNSTITGNLTVTGVLMSEGSFVELQDNSFIAPSIKNFRITNIAGQQPTHTFFKTNPNDYSGDEMDMRGKIATNYVNSTDWSKPTTTSNKLDVTVEWGYVNILGTGNSSTNTFTITQGTTPANNTLTDYYLWIPSRAENLRITGNTGQVLSLENENGTEWTNSGFTLVAGSEAWIHSNADQYFVTAIPVLNAVQDKTKAKQGIAALAESPTLQQAVLTLDPGTQYYFKIYGQKGKVKTEVVTMASGSWGNSIAYASPALIKHPDIDSTDATVTAASTTNGFNVAISGWSLAESFEICYTLDNNGANFTDARQTRIITSARSIDVTTSAISNWYIKCRPLIAGQQVASDATLNTIHGSTKGVSCVSGSSGNSPNDQVIVTKYITFFPFYGTLTFGSTISTTLHYVSLATMRTYVDATTLTAFPFDIIGEVITDVNGNDYSVMRAGAFTTTTCGSVLLKNVSGVTAPANGAFSLGVSKRARQVFKMNGLPINYNLSRIDVDVDLLDASDPVNKPLVIRVYQEGQESNADSVSISGSEQAFTSDADAVISSASGNRNLIIDLCDPSDLASTSPAHTYNQDHKMEAGFAGQVSVIGRPMPLTNTQKTSVNS